jgi:hypothetical protein
LLRLVSGTYTLIYHYHVLKTLGSGSLYRKIISRLLTEIPFGRTPFDRTPFDQNTI